jgi:hypothetical protein
MSNDLFVQGLRNTPIEVEVAAFHRINKHNQTFIFKFLQINLSSVLKTPTIFDMVLGMFRSFRLTKA